MQRWNLGNRHEKPVEQKMDKTIRLRNGSNRGAFVAKTKQTGGSCLFAQNLRELVKLTNPSLQEMCELFGNRTRSADTGKSLWAQQQKEKQNETQEKHPRSRNRKILPEPSKLKNQKNCGIIGEELPGSDAQGMMYLCDGPCTSSGLKASDLEKETIALASWKAKLNVIEFGC